MGAAFAQARLWVEEGMAPTHRQPLSLSKSTSMLTAANAASFMHWEVHAEGRVSHDQMDDAR